MSELLIKFRDHWADEMDLEGFEVMTTTEWNEYKNKVSDINHPIEIYWGTNESNEYPNGLTILDHLSVTEMTHEQANWIKSLFGTWYGPFPDLKQILDHLEEFEEDEDEEDEEDD